MKIDKTSPVFPTPYDVADINAFQALKAGVADKDQQQRALNWLLQAAGTFDLSYRPGSQRDSDFAEGKRFVGLQVHKLLMLDAARLSRLTKEK